MIGTVSPAGGNFEEPVTQGTLNTVKTFLGLSYERAYKRYYPAVDPLMSWSRYGEQLKPWFEENMGSGWLENVSKAQALLKQGDEIERMVQVTGEEGVSDEDYITLNKSQLVDMVYLQQDAFDDVDVSSDMDRQKDSFFRLSKIMDTPMQFESKADTKRWFNKMTDTYRNLNYAVKDSEEFNRISQELDTLVDQASIKGG